MEVTAATAIAAARGRAAACGSRKQCACRRAEHHLQSSVQRRPRRSAAAPEAIPTSSARKSGCGQWNRFVVGGAGREALPSDHQRQVERRHRTREGRADAAAIRSPVRVRIAPADCTARSGASTMRVMFPTRGPSSSAADAARGWGATRRHCRSSARRCSRVARRRRAVEDVVVVARPGQELPPLPPDVRIVRDEVEDRGSLGGLAPGSASRAVLCWRAAATRRSSLVPVDHLFERLGDGRCDRRRPAARARCSSTARRSRRGRRLLARSPPPGVPPRRGPVGAHRRRRLRAVDPNCGRSSAATRRRTTSRSGAGPWCGSSSTTCTAARRHGVDRSGASTVGGRPRAASRMPSLVPGVIRDDQT